MTTDKTEQDSTPEENAELLAEKMRPEADRLMEELRGAMTASEGVPEEGWQIEDFPQVTVAIIPHTTYPGQRPDPYISVTPDGWLFLEAGNVRLAIPDKDEWDKLVNMVERMWHTWARDVEDNHASIEEVLNYQPPPPPPSTTQEATAAAVGGVVASKEFEDMIHRAATEQQGEQDDDPDRPH